MPLQDGGTEWDCPVCGKDVLFDCKCGKGEGMTKEEQKALYEDGREPLKQIGIGGAPTRATTFPHDAVGRKQRPVASGVLDYFPDALVAVAHVSFAGNEQHNPGQPLHWARGKSTDEADALIRHFLQRGSLDDDGIRHSAKMVWRALALLQKEIEGSKDDFYGAHTIPGVTKS